jgi:4-amino-4-deoxy-L-arabinose transferase-like glycosyltransferase
LAAILVLAAVLRMGALDKPLYVDEIVTITVASQPLGRMAEAMREIDASPALYPLLLHFWLGVSHTDVWVRALSAIFGMLAVPMVGLVAARAFGWRAGLAAAYIMALAPGHVHYAQYVRSYSLFTLLASAHVWLFIEWLDEQVPVTRRRAAAAVIVTTALFYTHYLSVLLFAGEGLVALWRVRDLRRRVLSWGSVGAVAGILFLPGIPLLLHNVRFDRVRNADRPNPPALHRLVPNVAADMIIGQQRLGFSDPSIRRATLGLAAAVFPTLWLIGLVRGVRARPDMVLVLCAVSVVPIAIYLISGRKLVAVRFFLPFAAGSIALLGYGLSSLSGKLRWIGVVAVAAICTVPLWHFYRSFSWSYDHREVARAIGEASRPGDVILVTHPYEAFYYRWYLGTRLPVRGLVFTPLDEQDSYVIKPEGVRFDRARARIVETAARHPRMWLVGQSPRSFASDAGEEAKVLAWMDQTFTRVIDLGVLTASDPVVRLYEVRGPSRPESIR